MLYFYLKDFLISYRLINFLSKIYNFFNQMVYIKRIIEYNSQTR